MDANELLYYLKGHFELSNEPPSRDAWGIIRAHVLGATPADGVILRNPIPGTPPKSSDCGCTG
jgi:hypothetical protein